MKRGALLRLSKSKNLRIVSLELSAPNMGKSISRSNLTPTQCPGARTRDPMSTVKPLCSHDLAQFFSGLAKLDPGLSVMVLQRSQPSVLTSAERNGTHSYTPTAYALYKCTSKFGAKLKWRVSRRLRDFQLVSASVCRSNGETTELGSASCRVSRTLCSASAVTLRRPRVPGRAKLPRAQPPRALRRTR